MPIEIEPFTDIIFVHMPGCEACDAAMPELDKFQTSNPRMMIVKIRADGPMVERLLGRMKIRATPTYVIRRAGRGFHHEGMLTAKQITEWVDQINGGEE